MNFFEKNFYQTLKKPSKVAKYMNIVQFFGKIEQWHTNCS